jgi:hypothetical protein
MAELLRRQIIGHELHSGGCRLPPQACRAKINSENAVICQNAPQWLEYSALVRGAM